MQRAYLVGRVTSTYMFPYKEDLVRFDFEVDADDEHLVTPFPIAQLLNGSRKGENESRI